MEEFTFKTLSEILKELKKFYPNRYKLMSTGIANDSNHIKPRDEFEVELQKLNVGYFAYIKFFIESDEIYGIVAGKTGSLQVNVKGNDVDFSINTSTKGRRFLHRKDFKWYKEKVLVVFPETNFEDDKSANRKEALAIERDLKRFFSLFGS